MIIIAKKISTIGGRIVEQPERYLTKEEESTVIGQWGDDGNIWYFQKVDIGGQDWESYQSHLKQGSEAPVVADNIKLIESFTDEELRILKSKLEAIK